MLPALYRKGIIVKYQDGTRSLHRKPIPYVPSQSDEYYTVRENDTLLSIAHDKYGHQYLWYVIADVNPTLEDIFTLIPGELLLIPNYELIQSYG